MTPRQKVYDSIDAERAYQTKCWGSLENDQSSLDDFIHYMNDRMIIIHRHQVRRDNQNDKTPEEHIEYILDGLRKVAALAVAAMEKFGVIERK